jgi:hypothetical protein
MISVRPVLSSERALMINITAAIKSYKRRIWSCVPQGAWDQDELTD